MGVVSPKKAASVPSHHHHKLSQDVGKCELQVGGLYDYEDAAYIRLSLCTPKYPNIWKNIFLKNHQKSNFNFANKMFHEFFLKDRQTFFIIRIQNL